MKSLLFVFLLLVGCYTEVVEQHEFGWETEEIATVHHPVRGDITVRLLGQFEEIMTDDGLTAEEIAVVLDTTHDVYERHFGPVYQGRRDAIRRVTALIIDDTSSVWYDVCQDEPNDDYSGWACTLPGGWLFHGQGYYEPGSPVQIAMRRFTYNSSTGSIEVWVHEYVHTLLEFASGIIDDNHENRLAFHVVVNEASRLAMERLERF